MIHEREVIPKGLNPKQTIDQEKVQSYFFDDDYLNLKMFNLALSITDNPTLFYPGSGSDILTPLHYLRIFPNLKKINCIFMDKSDNYGSIKTILDDVGVCFEESNSSLKFYWGSILVYLVFTKTNVFTIDLPNFDIYFEKAFRAMKEDHLDYEFKIYNQLNKNGFIISDSGFQQLKLPLINVSPELSIYREMIIAKKVI